MSVPVGAGNDREPLTCEKCGSENIRTRWHKGSGYGDKKCGFNSVNSKSGEHLHQFCDNCLFDWTEPCPKVAS